VWSRGQRCRLTGLHFAVGLLLTAVAVTLSQTNISLLVGTPLVLRGSPSYTQNWSKCRR
jgi:hypothetical protein